MQDQCPQQFEQLYHHVRLIARQLMAGEPTEHTLQATALAHEAWLRLKDRTSLDDPAQFLSAAAEAMRRILIDHARSRMTEKRGGGRERHHLDELPLTLPLPPEELIAIHDCLEEFAAEDPVKAELVKLRIFGGLSESSAAAALGLSRATAGRYWSYARVRLYVLATR